MKLTRYNDQGLPDPEGEFYARAQVDTVLEKMEERMRMALKHLLYKPSSLVLP